MIILMLLILVTIISIIILIFLVRSLRKPIPKIIWTYWNSDDVLPDFIERCIQTWRDKNPDYEIIVLNDSKLSDYLSSDEVRKIKGWKYNDCVQKHSDLVRLFILSKYGGIWLDASIV